MAMMKVKIYQKCFAELGRILVRLEVGRLEADVIRFFTPES